jgi:hypothetical protein
LKAASVSGGIISIKSELAERGKSLKPLQKDGCQKMAEGLTEEIVWQEIEANNVACVGAKE